MTSRHLSTTPESKRKARIRYLQDKTFGKGDGLKWSERQYILRRNVLKLTLNQARLLEQGGGMTTKVKSAESLARLGMIELTESRPIKGRDCRIVRIRYQLTMRGRVIREDMGM